MGAKTGVLAFADGDIAEAIEAVPGADEERTGEFVARLYPGYRAERIGSRGLHSATYPPDNVLYALSAPGLEIACDRRFMIDFPSRLPEHLLRLGAGRRMVLHATHSVVDWLAFAVWEDRVLVRSLSLSPDSGILEDIGSPPDFELPYWAGEHPVDPEPDFPGQPPYPLPFHPLELGEAALAAMFGFVMEGLPLRANDAAENLAMFGYQLTDPTKSGRHRHGRGSRPRRGWP